MERNHHSQHIRPQGNENSDGPTTEPCVTVFRGANDVEIEHGAFPLVPLEAGTEAGNSGACVQLPVVTNSC